MTAASATTAAVPVPVPAAGRAGPWWLVLGVIGILGALGVLLGLGIIFNPLASAIGLTWALGVLAIAGGIALIVLAFRLR